ncbi:MAG: integrase, partial [Crocosphaera sp.]|nr:integrase [Crocosphaera sp.]
MKYVINDQIVLSQELEGPLKEYIGLFAAFISSQGYALYSTHRQVYLVACFSRWL